MKVKDLIEEDREFVSRLKWMEKNPSPCRQILSPEDQQMVRIANGQSPQRKRERAQVSEAYASMSKGGLAFTQFLHGNVNNDNQISVTDRVTGTDAIGVYAKVEAVTDDKRSKGYFQINASGSGFKVVLG